MCEFEPQLSIEGHMVDKIPIFTSFLKKIVIYDNFCINTKIILVNKIRQKMFGGMKFNLFEKLVVDNGSHTKKKVLNIGHGPNLRYPPPPVKL